MFDKDKIKIKICNDDSLDQLEIDVNEWLKDNENEEVIEIKFTKYKYDWGYNDLITTYFAAIIYKRH